MMENLNEHWETVYATKSPNEVSWTQEIPKMSLNLLNEAKLPLDAAIIDIGGGDSKFVDFLLEMGYQDVTVLDISKNALERAKLRLGAKASQVTWIHSNILDFKPTKKYEFWHDRATFHFLTNPQDIETYVNLVKSNVQGNLVIGTFSKQGPLKCSGLEIKQYDEVGLKTLFQPEFELLKTQFHKHITPFETSQEFIFCSFKKN